MGADPKKLKIATDQDNPDQDISKQTLDQTGQEKTTLDPFDAEALRLPPSFVETAGLKKLLSTVPVRKPHDQEFIRVHPDPAYRGNYACIKLKEDGEFYILKPEIAREISEETISVIIYTCVTKTGLVFLWPIKIPVEGAQGQLWHSSAHECAEEAMHDWRRIKTNRGLGAYEATKSDNPNAATVEPKWPSVSFGELLKLGFQKTGRYVSSFEHPVIKLLRG